MQPNLLSSQALNKGRLRDINIFKKGRMCKKPECNQRLSMYNPGPCCHAHAAWLAKQEDNEKERKRLILVEKTKKKLALSRSLKKKAR